MPVIAQRSFSGGEITPALDARTDLQKYSFGLKTCRNFIIMKEGGAQNRAGSVFTGEGKFRAKKIRIEEFDFGIGQTYLLEFGDLYVRFVKNGEYLTTTGIVITAITTATQAVVSSTAHGLANGAAIVLSGIVGPDLNGLTVTASDVAANTYKMKYLDGTYVDTSAMDAYVSGGLASKIYEVVTPYTEADVADLYFVQSADVLTITTNAHAIRELKRLGDTNWTLGLFVQAFLTPPSPWILTLNPTTGLGGLMFDYKVIAVNAEGVESTPIAEPINWWLNCIQPTAADPIKMIWDPVTGATSYNIYKLQSPRKGLASKTSPSGASGMGFIASTSETRFDDIGFTPDMSDTPERVSGFPDGNPAVATYFEQRLMLANTPTNPEKVWGSWTGNFKNFLKSVPQTADQGLDFIIAGRKFNPIKHMVDVQSLVIFTEEGEFIAKGSDGGGISAGNIDIKQHSYNGASKLQPIVVNGTAIYVQESGSSIRDIGFQYESAGYRGDDLTIFSSHLFRDFQIVDWAYQKTPDQVIWCVRDDGKVVAITYNKEQQVIACHRHDFEGGFVEGVCGVKENNETAIYFVVKRTINGQVARCVERMNTRKISDVKDMIFMDSAVTFDGRNTDAATTLTIEDGTDWTYLEELTLQCNQNIFTASMVGEEFHVTGPSVSDGVIRLEVLAFVDVNTLTVRPNRTVPVGMRNVALSSWARAVKTVGLLQHLEGLDVSVLGDGLVVASPHNSNAVAVTVADGKVELDGAYSVIHVGMPVTADMETLDIDTPSGETLMGKMKRVAEVIANFLQTRGFWVGARAPTGDDYLEGLDELKIREFETYDEAVALYTGKERVIIGAEWNSNGRIFMRQVDPLPVTILAIAPDAEFPINE